MFTNKNDVTPHQPMKALIASGVSLLVGLAIGGYIGYRYHDRHITNEAVEQMLEGMESSERLEAARGIRAIELIQSGDSQQAVQMFSIPIADFYSWHVNLTHNEQRTKDLLARIEQLARTNQAVAAQIKTAMDYGETNAKAH